MTPGVMLLAHGTVDSLDELPAFLTAIRRGNPAPPELVAELRHRYEAIGGKSPLNDINRRLASKIEAKLGVPVRLANRLANPMTKDVIASMASGGVDRLAVLPLAQYSAKVYADAALAAAREVAPNVEVRCAASWALDPGVVLAYARAIDEAFEGRDLATTVLVMSAHSLPASLVRAGDPYEREVRAAAEAIAAKLSQHPRWSLAFQSQGMSAGPGGRPVEWLGPDLPSVLDAAKIDGAAHVVVAPIGFLADHVEVLYDIDIEALKLARDRGLTLSRTRSLNDSDELSSALARIAEGLLS